MSNSPSAFKKIATPFLRLGRYLFKLHGFVFRPISIGVHAAVFDDEGRLLLVHHTYKDGWYIPGGGVKKGESLVEAIRRELREEVSIDAQISASDLFSVYYTRYDYKHNHVALFVVKDWEPITPEIDSLEILEYGFYAIDNLPEKTQPAVERHLQEVLDGVEQRASPPEDW